MRSYNVSKSAAKAQDGQAASLRLHDLVQRNLSQAHQDYMGIQIFWLELFSAVEQKAY
jgi:hypothetical protein